MECFGYDFFDFCTLFTMLYMAAGWMQYVKVLGTHFYSSSTSLFKASLPGYTGSVPVHNSFSIRIFIFITSLSKNDTQSGYRLCRSSLMLKSRGPNQTTAFKINAYS
jgi:hypothetical protein